jgi:hypothetical protein
MHDTGGGANVGVGVSGTVFLDEIDQACFALQQTEELQRAVRRGFDQRRCARLCCGRSGGRGLGALLAGTQGLDAGRELAIGKDREKAAKGKGDSAQQGGVGLFHGMFLVFAAQAAMSGVVRLGSGCAVRPGESNAGSSAIRGCSGWRMVAIAGVRRNAGR